MYYEDILRLWGGTVSDNGIHSIGLSDTELCLVSLNSDEALCWPHGTANYLPFIIGLIIRAALTRVFRCDDDLGAGIYEMTRIVSTRAHNSCSWRLFHISTFVSVLRCSWLQLFLLTTCH